MLYRSVELGERSVELGEKSVKLGEESVSIGRQMLEKQDGTIGAIKEISEKIDNSKEGIISEIRSLREDLKAYMEERFVRIEREIEEIKAKIGLS